VKTGLTIDQKEENWNSIHVFLSRVSVYILWILINLFRIFFDKITIIYFGPYLKGHQFLDLEGSYSSKNNPWRTNQLHGVEPFFRSRQLCSYSRNFQHFVEPGGSLPCWQEPSTGPYPETYHSSPHHPIISLLRSIYYYPPTYVLVFLMVSFLLTFSPTSYVHSFSSLFVLRAPPISSFLTWSL
jgi:hypothetical protein